MARRIPKIDTRCIRVSQSYSVPEVAKLLKRTAATIRAWIKEGLPVLPGTSPRLICGAELKHWLIKRANRRKKPCGLAKLFCCKCQTPRRPKPDTITTCNLTSQNVRVSGKCGVCGTQMQQSRKLSDLPAIIAAMKDPTQGQASLTGYDKPLTNSLFEQASNNQGFEAEKQDKPHVH